MSFSSTKENTDNTRGLCGAKTNVAKLMLLPEYEPSGLSDPDTVARNKSDWSA